MNITPNKLTISQLFATPNEQFIVPSYQRRYAWQYNQYKALYEDIDMLKENDGHLFGMIILHTHYLTGGLNKPELVDGQQRLTTLLLLLKAIHDAYIEKGKSEKAADIDKMIFCRDLNDIKWPKIQLGDLDNRDLLILLNENDFEGISNENIYHAYSDYYQWLVDLSLEELNKFFFKLSNIAVIIRLDVGLAQDAYKLFETINNRGLKLTPTDIIKNFLLGHAAKLNDKTILDKTKELWSTIITNLDQIDTDDFLRHYVSSKLNRRISSSVLVYEFKKYYMRMVKYSNLLGEFDYFEIDHENDEVEDIEPVSEDEVKVINNESKLDTVDFLSEVRDLSLIYQKIHFNLFDEKRINRRIENLNKILSKPSYIFLMYFLKDDFYILKDKLKTIKYIETLMLRRHICESRTNENDDIFAKLVNFIGEEDILNKIKHFIVENEYMPNDFDFKQCLPRYEFKGKLLDRAKYILEQIEYNLRGNTDELMVTSFSEVELEHIIPQTIDTKKSKEKFGDWESYLGDNSIAKHKKHVNLIGNMTLLGEVLNIQAYNNPFVKKKNSYKKSNFLITNELADQNDFKFSHLSRRSEQLSDIALTIWK